MKKKTLFIIGTLLIGAVLLSACGLMEAQGVSPTSERYIRVSGSGEVAVVPDIAYINIGVHSEAEDDIGNIGNDSHFPRTTYADVAL